MDLNDKQKRFCEEYVIDFNATQAAVRAGYSEKTANEQGCQNLAKLSIQEYIAELKENLRKANELTAQKVIDELAKLAFHNVQDFVNGGNSILEIKYIDRNKTAAVAGIKTKTKTIPGKDGKGPELETETELKFHSKEKALELLGRHFGIFEKDNEQNKVKLQVSLTKEETKNINDVLENDV